MRHAFASLRITRLVPRLGLLGAAFRLDPISLLDLRGEEDCFQGGSKPGFALQSSQGSQVLKAGFSVQVAANVGDLSLV